MRNPGKGMELGIILSEISRVRKKKIAYVHSYVDTITKKITNAKGRLLFARTGKRGQLERRG
jgi:hypothetical protein